MENRKLSNDPVRDEGPVQLRGSDFEPLPKTSEPKPDDPPSSYDCHVPRHDSNDERGGKRD